VKARARARANIAFAKYWGKADLELNLPAVPSLSMTLDGLVTDTEVRFSAVDLNVEPPPGAFEQRTRRGLTEELVSCEE